MTSESLLVSLRAAVEAAPDDLPLRMHLAQLLAASGDRPGAIRQAAAVLARDPDNVEAVRLISGAGSPPPGAPQAGSQPGSRHAQDWPAGDQPPSSQPAPDGQPIGQPVPDEPIETDEQTLLRLDSEFADVVPPRYAGPVPGEPDLEDMNGVNGMDGTEPVRLRLADVAGMTEVKARLEAGILAPMRNPDLVRLYGKSLRGGLLLYGPPGCGKTFIARAVAGEMGARFLTVALADVLDMYIGQSERNVREIFDTARRNAPCVLFLDEVDALGLKRTNLRNSAARGTVNQLLSELDGVAANNDGVYVLGATNHPWDVDVALRRPGRFDQMLLVLPPDEPARDAILRFHMRGRPIAGVDSGKLAKMTDGYSGADLAYVCERAAEQALLDSARSGNVRLIGMRDLEEAAKAVRPSIAAWLQTAKNVAEFANEGGAYDDLLAYLKKRRLL